MPDDDNNKPSRKTGSMKKKSQIRLLRIDQVAERLSCATSYVYALIAAGRLEAIRMGTVKGMRVTEQSLRDFVKAEIAKFQLED